MKLLKLIYKLKIMILKMMSTKTIKKMAIMKRRRKMNKTRIRKIQKSLLRMMRVKQLHQVKMIIIIIIKTKVNKRFKLKTKISILSPLIRSRKINPNKKVN